MLDGEARTTSYGPAKSKWMFNCMEWDLDGLIRRDNKQDVIERVSRMTIESAHSFPSHNPFWFPNPVDQSHTTINVIYHKHTILDTTM